MKTNNTNHHQSIRKRITEKCEPYPAQEKYKRAVDKIIYAFSIIGPVMTLPQVLRIWLEKNAESVSLITWSVYFIASFFWLLYGFFHKENQIILLNSLLLGINGMVVLGVIIY